jgi:plastocyanin
MLRDRSSRLAAVLVASFALVACGQEARIKPTAVATPVGVPSVPATVFPKPTTAAPTAPASGSATAAPTGSATASPTGGGGGGGGVEVKGTMTNKFEPETVTIKAGEKVTWVAEGFHSANSGKAPNVDPKGPIQSEMGFKTYTVTFKEKGTFEYFCQPHATLGMVGKIVVT